jgi:hypothetical protein
MADTITLVATKRVVVDLKTERTRINAVAGFNKKQCAVLLSALDAFEQGNLQGMIDIMQDKKSKKLFDYSTWEYLSPPYYDIVQDMCLERMDWKKEQSEG